MILTPTARTFLADARRATLATIDQGGLPRLVPICFVLAAGDDATAPVLYTPLDEKPKAVADPRGLARVRDILARPDVTVLVDRWSEHWTELAWLRVMGRATVLEPDEVAPAVVDQLRAKYPQYEAHDLASRPLIRIEIERATSWGAL